jgi:hypothetical protein
VFAASFPTHLEIYPWRARAVVRYGTGVAQGVESKREQEEKAAIGARIRVTVKTTEGRTRTIHRTVSSGGSFGASPLQQEIGLGDAASILRIEINWPVSRVTQTIRYVPMDRGVLIREGEGGFTDLGLKALVFQSKGKGRHDHH